MRVLKNISFNAYFSFSSCPQNQSTNIYFHKNNMFQNVKINVQFSLTLEKYVFFLFFSGEYELVQLIIEKFKI